MTETEAVAVFVPETIVQIGYFVVVRLAPFVSYTFTVRIVKEPDVNLERPVEIPPNVNLERLVKIPPNSQLALALLNNTIGTTVTVKNAIPPYNVKIISIYPLSI